ncbi:MAG: sigma-54-dependent Fis family transcriptional regulator [Kiritimatiellaeota bacterium]|nr:sigma-54-dependent Fis family transcriptional regulator [Kiritimatiellota bacterium]
MKKPCVLIIDDERHTREGLQRALSPKYEILLAGHGERGLELLRTHSVDVVLTDLRMPGMDGMTFIRRATALPMPPLIVMLTAYGTLQTAVEAMKVGAYDYLMKPVDLDNLEMVIERGLESRRLRNENETLRKELDRRYGVHNIVGNSPVMAEVLETVQQVARARTTVLLSGESGVGKELIAQAIHRISPRSSKPFVAVHCASLNPNLLESELFGHEKGAFTGAHERRIGRFERADGGTLFLDEIGEIDASIQVKLLRVLETHTFERVGGNVSIEVDVRLVTATNRDLKELVDAGHFREDLYYRLNVVHIRVPPLREHKEDIPLLLDHYLRVFVEENGKPLNGFTREALKVLTAYSWPGNVRELRNTVERMVVMARGTSLTLNDVPAELRQAVADSIEAGEENANGESFDPAPAPTLDITENERALIVRALRECNGNKSEAARKLGISRRTLHRRIHQYGLESFQPE